MLPPKVHAKNGRYFYVHQNKWYPLTRVSEGTKALYGAMQAWTSDRRPTTYGHLMMRYIAKALPELKAATQPEYLRIINGRLQHHFGHIVLNTLDSSAIAQYLELRKSARAAVGGNREKAVLGSIISWGMRFGWCSSNPCYGVRRNKERPSKRYVTDEELREVLDRAPAPLADLMAVAFLTGLRQGDLRVLTRANITDKGIEFNLAHRQLEIVPSYNVAPTQLVPVVREIKGERRLDALRWGLIPFFAKGEPPKFSTINARIEAVETAASYKGPWSRGQRCLQVASGFYEWHVDDAGRKAPFYIHLNDQAVFAFAALWDRSFKPDGTAIESCVHITMPANDLMRHVHNGGSNPHRMPAILRREDREAWLTGTVDQARAALKPYDAGLMVAYEVSTRVNAPKNNDPTLVEPAP